MSGLVMMGGEDALAVTSREIAELVESRHDNVKVAIERLAERGVIELPAMQEIPTATKPVTVYRFAGEQGKRDSIVVVAQLSPEFTARLVDRWQAPGAMWSAGSRLASEKSDPMRRLWLTDSAATARHARRTSNGACRPPPPRSQVIQRAGPR